MATQNGDYLGDLGYSRATIPIVRSPKNLNEVLNAREQQYLQSVQNETALENMMTNLKYLPQDEQVYNALVDETKAFSASLTPDNMADNVLNTYKFANDFTNKKGGKQLAENYANLQSAYAEIDKNEGITPDMKDYYKAKVQVSPVTKSDVTGFYNSGRIGQPKVNPYVDAAEEAIKLFDGIKADGYYDQNEDGTVTIKQPIPGLLQYNKGDIVTQDRIIEGLTSYFNSRPDIQGYFGDRSDFITSRSQNPLTDLYSKLTPNEKKNVLGNENASEADLKNFLDNKGISAQQALKNANVNELTKNAIQPAVSKLAFKNVQPTVLTDDLLMKAVGWKAETEKDAPLDNSITSIQDWNTMQAVNPSDYIQLENDVATIKTSLPTLRNDIATYEIEVNKKTPGYTTEELNRKREQLAVINKKIEQVDVTKRNVTDAVYDLASKKGINITKEFANNNSERATIVQQLNARAKSDELNKGRGDFGGIGYVRVPTETEYKDFIASKYAGSNKGQYDPASGGTIIDGVVYSERDIEIPSKLKSLAGEFNIPTTRDLSYLHIEGETQKQSLKKYNNLLTDEKHTLKSNPETYMVGERPLSSVLADYGIEDLRADVDWDKTDIQVLLQNDDKGGILRGINLALTKTGLENLNDDAKEMYQNTNSIKVNASYEGKNKGTRQELIQSTIRDSFRDIVAGGTKDGTYQNVIKASGEMYANATGLGKTIDDANLYTLLPGRSTGVEINHGGNKIPLTIEATAKTALGSALNNTDFRVYTGEGSNRMVLVQDKGGQYKFENASNTSNVPVDFENPGDIKQWIGGSALEQDASKVETKVETNPYTPYLQQRGNINGYKKVSENDIKSTSYNAYTRSLPAFYNQGNANIPLKSMNGQTSYIEARVPKNDLVDFSSSLAGHIAPNIQLPYINKNVVTYAIPLVKDNKLLVTGGFRGENTHDHLKNSNKDSPHKYGYALDIEDNAEGLEFKNKLMNNPELLKQYNIARMLQEGNHLHVEFNTPYL